MLIHLRWRIFFLNQYWKKFLFSRWKFENILLVSSTEGVVLPYSILPFPTGLVMTCIMIRSLYVIGMYVYVSNSSILRICKSIIPSISLFMYSYWKWNFTMTRSVRLSVGWLDGLPLFPKRAGSFTSMHLLEP